MFSWFFGHKACGILAPRPGIEPTPPALEGKFLTTGLPGKSLFLYSWIDLSQKSVISARYLWLFLLVLDYLLLFYVSLNLLNYQVHVSCLSIPLAWQHKDNCQIKLPFCNSLPLQMMHLAQTTNLLPGLFFPWQWWCFLGLQLISVCHQSNFLSSTKKTCCGTSLVEQWLRIRLPMQGTRVWSLVQEDPTCHRGSKPVRHNYWACALEPVSHNYWSPRTTTTEPMCLNYWSPHRSEERRVGKECRSRWSPYH